MTLAAAPQLLDHPIDVIVRLSDPSGRIDPATITPKLKDLVPRWKDIRDSAPAIARGSIIGFIFGIIPGVSHVVSTFVSYAVEKRFSKHPEEFGKGAIAGVAGPETANNAVTGTAMIPLLALGIPSIPGPRSCCRHLPFTACSRARC